MTERSPAERHRPAADPAPVPCKVCHEESYLVGVVDFSKHCPAAPGFVLGHSGVPVYYRQCRSCGLVFTLHCDDWGPAEFEAHIYNDQYHTVDPDYLDARPRANATLLNSIFGASREQLMCLDYGGGNGKLCDLLRGFGFRHAQTFDPFDGTATLPTGRSQLLTCFEVLEHVPWPRRTVADMVACIDKDGIAFFSTLVLPAEFPKLGLAWWYVAPRNGHITLYTRIGLAKLWAQHGFRFGSLNDNLHVAYREVPAFAAHLIKPA